MAALFLATLVGEQDAARGEDERMIQHPVIMRHGQRMAGLDPIDDHGLAVLPSYDHSGLLELRGKFLDERPCKSPQGDERIGAAAEPDGGKPEPILARGGTRLGEAGGDEGLQEIVRGGRRELELAREIADSDPIAVQVEGLQQAKGFFDGLDHDWERAGADATHYFQRKRRMPTRPHCTGSPNFFARPAGIARDRVRVKIIRAVCSANRNNSQLVRI